MGNRRWVMCSYASVSPPVTWGLENKDDVYCFCRICVFGCPCEALKDYYKTGGS